MTVDGLISIASRDSYTSTVDRLDAALADRSIVPMLRWDHSAAAIEVGLKLRPLLLIVFGDPRVGTVLMQEKPTVGIDLPLKLLIWESEADQVWVSFNDPSWIRARHGLGAMPSASAGMAELLRNLALTVADAGRT